MKTACRSLATLLFSLLLLSTTNAQTPRDRELPIDSVLPNKQSITSTAPVIVTASASSQRVRYISIGEVNQTRLQVFSADGTQVFDSNYRLGNLIDWPLSDSQGAHLSAGSYLFLVTVKDFSGNLTQKYGTAALEQEQVYLEQTAQSELTPAETTALEANQHSETLSPVDRIGAAGLNGTMPASNAGGTVIDATFTGKNTTVSKAATGGENIAGSGSQNRIARWLDNAGTLGDSNLFTDASGNIGIGTPTPGGQLHIFGTAGQDVFAGMGPDLINGPALNFGYAGSSFGRGAGFFNVRPDASAVAPNPSLRFATANVQRMIITNTGNVGIGTLTPGAKLDVVATSGSAVAGNSPGTGVFGRSDSGSGVYGSTADGYGVRGISDVNGIGVYGVSGGNGGVGVYGFNPSLTGEAGHFTGNVGITNDLSVANNLSLTYDLNFFTNTRQKINLYGTGFGIGVQTGTLYFRSNTYFAWYKGGVHSDTAADAGGGVRTMFLDPAGNLFTSGAMTPSSDRNMKANISSINARSILAKVAAMPIHAWNYKADQPSVRHIGPMAQDFSAAFGVGADDKHIATVDADGVALASIQALYQMMLEKDRQIESLSCKLGQQQAELNQLKRTIKRKHVSKR
jgi:hypothetical protein